jgi:acetylornithine deacetylase/succinyl-diaminopimelate desuccinylase family protein
VTSTTKHQEAVPRALAERVAATVDDQRPALVELVQALVRIPSENPKLSAQTPGGEGHVQDFVVTILEEIGASIDRWEPLPGRPNLVGTIAGTGGGRSLALNGHIDVVPAGDEANWTYPPYGAEIHDGRIYGRGALDMKGGVGAMLVAALTLKRLGIRLKGDVFLESVIDEETGGPGTRATIERGYRPDFALVVEPTVGLSIMPVEGGLEWLRVTVTGVSGHSAFRFRSVHAGGQGTAVSALDKAVKLLGAVAELERMWANRKVHPLLPPGITTINTGAIAAGSGGGANGMPNVMTSVSSLPDYCAIDWSLKYLPSERGEDVRQEFETFLHHVCQADDWLREHPPTIEWGLHGVSFPPADTPADHPAIATLTDAIRQTGIDPPIRGFEAVSDIAWFGEAGIASALCGPGEGDGAHGLDEHVMIDSLVTATKAITLFMLAWCGYEE